MKSTKITTYSQETVYKKGILPIFKEMATELYNSRELGWQFFLRDFKAKYKQSILGILWLFISPLITVGMFLVLNSSGVLVIGDVPIAYPIYGLVGLAVWEVIASGWTTATNSLSESGALIEKIRFPNEVIVISSLAQIFPNLIIRFSLILVLMLIYGAPFSVSILTIPLSLIPLILLALGLSFFTSILNAITKDVLTIINSIMSVLLFLTPIMYSKPDDGIISTLSSYNPLYFLVNGSRDLLVYGHINNIEGYSISSLFSIAIFLVGWLSFHIAQPRIVERL